MSADRRAVFRLRPGRGRSRGPGSFRRGYRDPCGAVAVQSGGRRVVGAATARRTGDRRSDCAHRSARVGRRRRIPLRDYACATTPIVDPTPLRCIPSWKWAERAIDPVWFGPQCYARIAIGGKAFAWPGDDGPAPARVGLPRGRAVVGDRQARGGLPGACGGRRDSRLQIADYADAGIARGVRRVGDRQPADHRHWCFHPYRGRLSSPRGSEDIQSCTVFRHPRRGSRGQHHAYQDRRGDRQGQQLGAVPPRRARIGRIPDAQPRHVAVPKTDDARCRTPSFASTA